jgi:hypothetical protein
VMRPVPLILVACALAISGCAATRSPDSQSPATPSQAVDPCSASAVAYSGRVIASFVTTIGAIRAMPLNAHHSDLWPGLPGDSAAVLCYIDGEIAKGPPDMVPGTGRPTFDRAAIVVVDGRSDLIAAGYRENLSAVAP